MKENRKLMKEVLKDIRHDMTDEEVLNLLADSKISVSPKNERERYTLVQRAADSTQGSAAIIVLNAGFCLDILIESVVKLRGDQLPFAACRLAV